MSFDSFSPKLNRRTLVKAAALGSIAQIASPFVITARAADNVKIGLDNPLTGTFAAVGKNELLGAQLAVDQINAKGGILGRKVDLLVEDSTSGEAAVAVQKANKLIERDKVDFLLGNINSALAQAMANVSFEKKVFHIVPGGHTDSVTGTQCHWNVFRVCNTTRMETNSVSKLLLKNYGKKWYFITTDYAFGRSLQVGFEASLKAAGGTELGADYTPLGTTDFSANLIKAQSTKPDALILLLAGDDMVNCLKQAVQFGLDKKTHIAGAQQELEVNLALPPQALLGDWCFEWYWKQPGVPHVAEFVADIRKRSDRAYVVRLCRDLELLLGRREGQVARRGQDGQGDAGHGAAAGSRTYAERPVLPRRRQPVDANTVRGHFASCASGRRQGGPLQGVRIGQGNGCGFVGPGDRLQDGMAELTLLIAGRRG
jgi:branched-chain amino acid transport system substrate-binding protein